MDVGKRIRILRTSCNMTQEELGEKLGVKKAAIQKYESGSIVNLKTETIERIATIFDVTPSYIVGWDEFDKKYNLDEIKQEIKMIDIFIEYFGNDGFELFNSLSNLNNEGIKKIILFAEDINKNPDNLKNSSCIQDDSR